MKRILLSTLILFNFSLLISHSSFAQAPGKFKYQAVVRDANGSALQGTNVDIRFELFDHPTVGAAVYQEDHQNEPTGDFGVVNLEIGASSDLTTLDWATSNYYVLISMRPNGTTGPYVPISSERTQLVSVPYALYALSAGGNTTYTAGTNITIDGNNQISASFTEVDGSTSNELQQLSLSGSTLSIATGGNGSNSVDLSSLIPPGMIVAYGGTTAPAGWLMCDGSTIPTGPQYAALTAVLNNAFGINRLPDFRGRFLRGSDDMGTNAGAAGLDPNAGQRTAMNTGGNTGNNVGSVQLDDFKSHTHINGGYMPAAGTGGSSLYNTLTNYQDRQYDRVSGPSGGSETRPKNAYVNYIIKY